MIQLQEDTQTGGMTEGWTDTILWNHSGYCQESNKYNGSRLVFKSQRYRVQRWSNQKLLHHLQHAKNKLNS